MSSTINNSKNAIVWEYESDIQGLYAPFEDKTSNYIESQYSISQTQKVSLGNFDHALQDYEIDFRKMIQRNLTSRNEVFNR